MNPRVKATPDALKVFNNMPKEGACISISK
jgi:hypothetical protein